MIKLVEHSAGITVRIRGDLDARTALGLRDALGWAVEHHRLVVVDLRELDGIAPAGITVLRRAHQRAHLRAGLLCIAAPVGFRTTGTTPVRSMNRVGDRWIRTTVAWGRSWTS